MFYLFFVSLLWAFSFGLIKGNLTGLDSNFVSFVRLFLSMIVFLPLVKFKKVNRKISWRLIITGMVQYGLMYITYIYSFQYLQAFEVALFTIFTPIYVTIINSILKKKVNVVFFLTALMAIIGTGIVKYQDLSQSNILIGFLIVQISNVSFAFGQVYYKITMKDIPDVKDQEVFGILYIGGVMITALVSGLFTDFTSISITTNQWVTLIYLGIVASGFAFFLWNLGARKVNIGALAIFNNLKVPLAVAVSLLVFGESANVPNLLLGGIIVVLSLVINEYYVRQHKLLA